MNRVFLSITVFFLTVLCALIIMFVLTAIV
jgi:hypothetical protein